MKVVYRNGRLLAIAQYENNSNFWEADLTEAIDYDDEKLKVEVTLAIDHWMSEHHEEFKRLWGNLRYFFINTYAQNRK